jgi:predicted dehydrogenase
MAIEVSRTDLDMRPHVPYTEHWPTVRLAIVGLGLVGRRHADAIDTADGIDLCAVVDPDESACDLAAARSVPCFGNLNEMIAAKKPDGIILSTPTALHSADGIKCIDAGIPVLIEKPITDDLCAAEALVEHSEACGIPVMVGHHRRFNPIIQSAKAALTEGRIGDIRAVEIKCWFYKPDTYFEIAPWRKLKGAGPISVNLVHDIDLLRHLCGEIVQVQAQMTPASRGYDNEDVAAALFKFDNGIVGTATVSDSIVAPWSWECTSKEYPIYPFTGQSAYHIGGSHGALSIPDLTLWHHDGARDWWSPLSATKLLPEPSDPLVNQIKHFAAVIKRQAEPMVSGREGLRTLAVIDAIQRAGRTGQTIQLADTSQASRPTGPVSDPTAVESSKSPLTNPAH